MRRELGAIFKLLIPDDPTDGYSYACEVIPKESRCKGCQFLLIDWHPKPPPTVRLMLSAEELQVGLLGMPVLHEAFFEIIRPFWPEAMVTRCASHPKSELKIGERYLSLSLPEKYTTWILHPSGRPWQCSQCKRWIQGPGHRDPYIALHAEQEDGVVFTEPTGAYLMMYAEMRRRVQSLGIGTFAWESIPVFSEPLPQHVIPEK